MEDPRNFNDQYTRESPPWEIGAPQPSVMEAFNQGLIKGKVLDVGCGTGQNSVWLAKAGADVTGIDISSVAVERAKKLAQKSGVNATFAVASALDFSSEARFQTVLDSAVFHIFDDSDQARYLDSVKQVLKPGGAMVGFGFSELEPEGWGPRRLSEENLRETYRKDWVIESLERISFQLQRDEPVHAWRWVASLKGG